MEIDRTKLARFEREASQAQAVYERLRDDLSEVRRREGFDRAFLTKALYGLHSRKHQHIKDLAHDLPALAIAADEAGLPGIAQQARQIFHAQQEAKSLETALAAAQERSLSLNCTARRCREFAASVDGTAQPYRPPALAPRY